MTATIRDVAKAAGVHPGTVSRALNAETKYLVNSRTAMRIARIAAELGYEANPLARGLKTTKSFSIGLVIPDITSSLFALMARGIEDVTLDAGYTVLIADTNYSDMREKLHIEFLRSRRVDGLISATGLIDAENVKRITDSGVKVAFLNRTPSMPGISSVVADDARGIELSVLHLISIGHTRIAHLAGPSTTSTGQLRARAFRSAMSEQGQELGPSSVIECEHFRESDGALAMERLLDSGAGFTAVVAADDRLALGGYQTLRKRGLSCPQDISIVGYNDLPLMEFLDPPLTTVTVPHYDMGIEVATLMLGQLAEAETRHTSVVLPVSLRLRGSTSAPSR